MALTAQCFTHFEKCFTRFCKCFTRFYNHVAHKKINVQHTQNNNVVAHTKNECAAHKIISRVNMISLQNKQAWSVIYIDHYIDLYDFPVIQMFSSEPQLTNYYSYFQDISY